jgi:hypothetical protein
VALLLVLCATAPFIASAAAVRILSRKWLPSGTAVLVQPPAVANVKDNAAPTSGAKRATGYGAALERWAEKMADATIRGAKGEDTRATVEEAMAGLGGAAARELYGDAARGIEHEAWSRGYDAGMKWARAGFQPPNEHVLEDIGRRFGIDWMTYQHFARGFRSGYGRSAF